MLLSPEAPFVLHRVFDVGEGAKCESFRVLPSSPGRRSPHPALLCQQRGRVPHSKKHIFLLARDGRQPGQVAQLTAELHGTTVCAGECAGTASRTSCRDAQGAATSLGLQTHLQGIHLSHPTGASASWLASAGAQPAQVVPGTGAHWGAASLPHCWCDFRSCCSSFWPCLQCCVTTAKRICFPPSPFHGLLLTPLHQACSRGVSPGSCVCLSPQHGSKGRQVIYPGDLPSALFAVSQICIHQRSQEGEAKVQPGQSPILRAGDSRRDRPSKCCPAFPCGSAP